MGKKRGNDHGVPIAEGREGGKEKKRERSASFALHTWQDYNRKVVSTVYPSSLSKHPAENPKPIFLFLFFEERKKTAECGSDERSGSRPSPRIEERLWTNIRS